MSYSTDDYLSPPELRSIVFRFACGLAITAFIFVHSPERSGTAATHDAARWLERTRDEITQAALTSAAAQHMFQRSLRSPEAKPAH